MTGSAELFRSLGALCEPPTERTPDLADALGLERAPRSDDFVETFVLQLYPYASVYLGEEGMLGGDARDRVAGFWRALGMTPPVEPDHLAALLGLYASLIEAVDGEEDPARRELLENARSALLWEHLLSWTTPYLQRIISVSAPYGRWAWLLRYALNAEVARSSLPSDLPLALRASPGLPDEAADARSWTQALLAPIRTGMILTRADLVRGAGRIGVGARLGERAFILRSMLEQDSRAVLYWLASEALTWGKTYESDHHEGAGITAWWERRARQTAAVLRNATRRGSFAAATD